MSLSKKPILVISISSGENEASESIKWIHAQKNIEFDFEEIRDLRAVVAHEVLYSTIMSNSEKFSYFVKVDGDMVFSRETVLSEMIAKMRNDVSIDHGVFSVFDWYTQKAIMGMHIFSRRCKWGGRDPLFTDSGITFPGRRMLFWDSPSPVAQHSPNPSLMQAFQFGYHRCLKIMQKDRFCPNLSQSIFQFNLLKNVHEQYLINRDPRRKAALFGASDAMRKSGMQTFGSRDHFSGYESAVSAINNNMCHVDRLIERTWGAGFLRKNLIYNSLLISPWLRGFLCSLLCRVKRFYDKLIT